MSRRIRVAHVIETIHLGGVEQTRLALAKGLDPERFEQIIVCTKALGVLPGQFEQLHCHAHTVGTFRNRIDWGVIGRVRKVLRDFKPDIVHGAVFEGVTAATIAGRLEGVRVIIGEETADPMGRRLTGHAYFAALSMMCTRVVAVSEFIERYLLETLHLPRVKVVLVNNGIVASDPTPPERIAALRRELGLIDDHFVIGNVGRLLDVHKRNSDSVRAVALLRDRLPQLRLVIVGDGPDKAMLQEMASKLGIADRVIFAGYQGETRPYFDCFDVLVHVPSSEAFGLVVVEAMMAARPVIASRVGGITQIVADKETGLLVDRYDPGQLADAILSLEADSAGRLAMGLASVERAQTYFSQERYVRDIDQLYSQLVAGKL